VRQQGRAFVALELSRRPRHLGSAACAPSVFFPLQKKEWELNCLVGAAEERRRQVQHGATGKGKSLLDKQEHPPLIHKLLLCLFKFLKKGESIF